MPEQTSTPRCSLLWSNFSRYFKDHFNPMSVSDRPRLWANHTETQFTLDGVRVIELLPVRWTPG
jgi:hypothetical protein